MLDLLTHTTSLLVFRHTIVIWYFSTGGGEFLCVECSRHFVSTMDLGKHQKTKIHKRRLKQLKDDPYSQAEAEQAAGLSTDNRRRDLIVPVKPSEDQAEAMAQ